MSVLLTNSRRHRVAALALSAAAVPFVALGAPGQASAATSIVGSYTMYQRVASSGGSVTSATLRLKADHTCSGTGTGCTWKLSGTAFELDSPNPRRGGNIYRGTVTSYGLNTPTNTGGLYYGYTGSTREGDWWAKKL